MQLRRISRAARACAALLGVWLVACTLLGARHAALVGHVRDARGVVVHGAALVGHHDGATGSDFHRQRDPDADHGECALADAVSHAVRAPLSLPPTLPAPPIADASASPDRVAPMCIRVVLRDAPKTSPPVG